MKNFKVPKGALWRVPAVILLLLGLLVLAYLIWTPGKLVNDGRHDLGRNGLYLQHGWLGHDQWFWAYNKTERMGEFHNTEEIKKLALLLRQHRITEVFPHLCPTSTTGQISKYNSKQIERLLYEFEGINVIPWVGGVWGVHAFPERPSWRTTFISSVTELLALHPGLAGIHINIEPLPSGNKGFLLLLRELKKALPEGRILSVAAYPPPTLWQPFDDVHWDESYYREILKVSDQVVVMMYDTSIQFTKFYKQLLVSWTQQVLSWGEHAKILFALPTYDDEGVGYHNPEVENLEHSLAGLHGGLEKFSSLPEHYQGVVLYCEWETDSSEWDIFYRTFFK